MKQAVHILNKFSDDFVAAILERHDTEGVLQNYVSSYPELEQDIRDNAVYLSEVYGYLQNAPLPSQQQANAAYAKVTAKLGQNPATASKEFISTATPRWSPSSMLSWLPIKKFNEVGQKRTVRRPAFGLYLSGAMGVALALIAILLWSPSKPTIENAQNGNSGNEQPATGTTTTPNNGEYATSGDGKPGDARTPFETPGGEVRGDGKQQVSSAQKAIDSQKVVHLGKIITLASPTAVTVKVKGSEADLSWNASEGALNYIVEIKAENTEDWQQAKVVPITRTKLNGLTAGKYSVRVTATAGEKRATPGKASTFTVE